MLFPDWILILKQIITLYKNENVRKNFRNARTIAAIQRGGSILLYPFIFPSSHCLH